MVDCFNKMLIRIWISGNCWLFILLGLLTSPQLLINHFVLITHFHTPPGMTSYYCEVGLLSSASSQEQAPPCISIIPHPCSSQGPGTKSKESLLSRTKLFNAVISCIFFIPPFAIGNETWWKIWCVVLHTNEGPWIFLSFTVMGLGYVLQQRETHFLTHECETISLSVVSLKERKKILTSGCAGLDYCSTLAHCLILAISSPEEQACRNETRVDVL